MILVFIGFNLTFFPQFIMGSHGSPRRWATYPIEFQPYHRMSTIGAYIMATGFFMVGSNWFFAALWGRKAAANPWGGNSLEWQTPSPPPFDNFAVPPVADDPYNLGAWIYDPAIEGWVKKPQPSQPVPVTH